MTSRLLMMTSRRVLTAPLLPVVALFSALSAGSDRTRRRGVRRPWGWGSTSRGTGPKAMACVTLLLLHLAYSGLATVHSSLMPYGADGSLFVEQRPPPSSLLNHLLLAAASSDPNASRSYCEGFVHPLVTEYLRVRHSALEDAVRRLSAWSVLGRQWDDLNTSSSASSPPFGDGRHQDVALVLNDVVTSLWLLAEHDARVLETSVTLRTSGWEEGETPGTGPDPSTPPNHTTSGGAYTTPTVLYARVQRVNGSLHLSKNWDQRCEVDVTHTDAGLAGLTLRSSTDCLTNVGETRFLQGQTGSGSTIPTPRTGYWHALCADPGERAQATSAMFVYDLIDLSPPRDGNHSRQEQLRGTMSVSVDLGEEDVDQCDIAPSSDLSALRHKCRASTRCVNTETPKEGLRLGAYTCLCTSGHTFKAQSQDDNSTWTHFSGLQLEKEYHRLKQGLPNSYATSYDCLPCHTTCDWPFCLGDSSCSLLVDLEYRIPILTITMATMAGVLTLMVLTFKYRNDKMMRASTPGLLSITLFGTFLLYSEVIVAAFKASHVTCMLRPWVRHVGFSLVYGGVLFKTWRISIIMRVFKSRAFKTKDSELYKKVCVLTFSWIVFLVSWTVLDPLRPVQVNEGLTMCTISAWSYVGFAGEICLLLWGAYVCYQARKAPNLYNETRQVSYAIWNEAIWEVFVLLARFLLHFHPDPNTLLTVRFLRTQLTVSTLLLLLFTPKFIIMFRKIRQVHGTLTDVYGSRRVHRLSLMVNKHGDIKTIYCTPCGPLAYIDQSEESDASSRDSHNQNVKEDEYSKAEVDSLIELVSRLKSERELYKMQVKRLLQLLRSTRRKPNGLSPSLVAEDPDGHRRPIDFPDCDVSDAYPDDVMTRETPSRADLEEAQFFQCTASAGPRSSRASTVTTFVSSSTADDASSFTEQRGEGPFLLPVDNNGADALNIAHPQGSQESSPPCKNCNGNGAGRNGISRYALTVLTRKLAQNHVTKKDLSPDADMEDFPRMLHSHEETCNNNKVSMRDLIPTVYGDFCDTLLGQPQQSRELQDMTPSVRVHRRTLSSESADSADRREKATSSEKLNFIMYI